MSDVAEMFQASYDDGNHGNEYEDLERLQLPLPGVEPLYFRLLVAPVSPPKKTSSGLYLPDATADAQDQLSYIGKVVATGPGAFQHERLRVGYEEGQAPAELGDYVLYKRFAGMKMTYKGLKLLAVNDDDILMRTTDPHAWRVLL
jgi:co-chaperonin GroES (HSP10)